MCQSNGSRHYSLITGGGILMIAIAIAAWSSNPDEASFRRWVSREVKHNTDGAMQRVAGSVLSQIALRVVDWEHIDYGFFSIAYFPDSDVAIVGAFGTWWLSDIPGATEDEHS